MKCSELKEGQILICERCGIEFKVVKQCGDERCNIGCVGDIDCCGEPIKLKE